ncbi:MAG: SPFH domain-containing protein [Streptosporangiales bacterium]|nr:SPFH domain-containing protein [Streptosporangiales bacterium]
MSWVQTARQAVSAAGGAQGIRQAVGEAASEVANDATEGFGVDPGDFLSAREQSASVGTQIVQQTASLNDAGEILNRSYPERAQTGEFINVIAPVIMPKRRTFLAMLPAALLILIGLIGLAFTAVVGGAVVLFGPHYWFLVLVVTVFSWWRRSVVMVPEGCQALITKFGKLDRIVGPGRSTLLDPRKRVAYIVNTTREYPYNAPIREAPTLSGVRASVDLFLQFRIESPSEFIFVLGAVRGFSDKLQNAISEVTRSLIYEQRAEDIYDLVGENTQTLLERLNEQFLPAVRLTSANITHAEPSSQDYRMDLAAPEMVRVAKEAYTYEYELKLRKEQNDGDLNRELAALQENLSAIRAEIAGYQAQMDTALERETNRAKAMARQRFVEAESTANANAALLEAQALDIQAVSAAAAPEILEYRFQQEILDKLSGVAGRLPQVVQMGDGDEEGIDFLAIARRLVGSADDALFSETDLAAIRTRMEDIKARIAERESEIEEVLAEDIRAERADRPTVGEGPGESAGAEEVEEIRRSVRDESVVARVEQLSGAADSDDVPLGPDGNPGQFPPAGGEA